MKVFAISDLHLSSAVNKPMDIFGPGWDNYFEKITADWTAKVQNDDIVLIGGDISWGISIEEAAPDFALLSALPGRKVVLRGNHDYYWNSLSKLRTAFPDFLFLQNNCIRIGNILIAGSRGWTIPTTDTTDEDLKIYNRELMRLKMSLDAMESQRCDDDYVIALLHFPPFDVLFNDSEVTALLEEYKVDKVLYGHLHGKNARVNHIIEKNNITYHLTSCDLIGNKLIEVL